MQSGRSRSELVARAELPAAVEDAMWSLFRRYYVDVSRTTFRRDLAQKRHVILLLDTGDGSIRGFSTIDVDERVIEGRRVVSLFSGDTIVDEAYWGQKTLHRAFVRYLARLKLRHPRAAVYWFLISKGYKTYLLLTRNVPFAFPRHDRPTPPFEQAVLHHLAEARFGAAYDRSRGVLRFSRSQGRLRDGVAPVEARIAALPEVRFFVERNPGHARGDELCCLGRIDLGLFFTVARRVLLSPLVKRLRGAAAPAPASPS
jgi:hypothetical protein